MLDGDGESVRCRDDGLDSPTSSTPLSSNLDDSEWRRFLLPIREGRVDGDGWLSTPALPAGSSSTWCFDCGRPRV